MKAPRNMLVPVDRSLFSLSALQYAEQLARIFEAEITVVHVIEWGMRLEGSAPDAQHLLYSDLIEEQRRTLISHLLVDNGLVSQSIKILIRHGSPAKEIVRAAADIHADLIVLSTHGRTGLRHVALGSVAEKVVRTSLCPVLTVKPEEFRELISMSEDDIASSLHLTGWGQG
jgi:universal stress protein A